MNRQQISTLLLALGVLLVFSNWGRLSEMAEARLREEAVRPRKVVYWSNSGSPEAELKRANQFMEAHPDVMVQPNFRETGGLQDILYVSFLSGNPPDFMNARVQELRQYALIGGVRPLDDLLEAEGPGYHERHLDGEARIHRFNVNPHDRYFERDADGTFLYPKEAARLLNLSGRVVGLREVGRPDTLTYNKRLFREAAKMFPDAGLTDANGEPQPPRTWLELYEKAKVITEYGRRLAEQRGEATPVCYGLVMQGERSRDLMRGMQPLARRAGSMAFNFNGDLAKVQAHFDTTTPAGREAAARYAQRPVGYFEYDHPSAVASFALLLRMRNDGLVLPGVEARHYEDVRTSLAAGQAAMLIDGWHAALIGTERVPWASADLGSAPIPVPYPDEGEAEKAAIEKLLALDELGLSLPPGNKLPRTSGDELVFFTSLCRDPQAAWDWNNFGASSIEIMQSECRRGLVPMLTEAVKHLGDREWFPFPFQPQVYDTIRNHSEMWPAPPQHGPVAVPTEQDIFFKYFYQADPMPMAETLRAVRGELSRYADAANRDLAQRIQDGVASPEQWSFADFSPRTASRFFERQQDSARDQTTRNELDQIRADLVAQLQTDGTLAPALLDEKTQDLREDLWKFEKNAQPWLILWVPGLMMLSVLLWLFAYALRNLRRRQEAWDALRLETRGAWRAYVFVVPGMILLFAFAIYPSLYQFVIATQRGNGLGTMQSVGLDNFARILDTSHPRFDATFWTKVVPNTLLYMLVVTAGQVGFGMMIASLLNLPLRANSFYRVLFFVPLVTSLAIVSVILIGLLKGEDSGLNQFLLSSGLQNIPYRLGLVDEPGKMINWLGEKTGLWTIMAVGIWHGLPYNIILLLAGLQSISPDLYEAARVDGASSAQRFRHVTLPEILPILLIIAFQAFIGAAKAFSVVFVLTEGGINHSSELVSTYIFKWGFMKPEGREADLGYASALGIVYSVLLAALTLTNVIIIARRWKRRLEMEAQAGGRVVVA